MGRVKFRVDTLGVTWKICTRCGKEKELSEFGRHSLCAFNKNPWCKSCVKDYALLPSTISRRTERYHKKSKKDPEYKKKANARALLHYQKNKDKKLKYASEYRSKEPNKNRQKAYHEQYRIENSVKLKRYIKAYVKKNKDQINQRTRLRKKNDIVFRLRTIVSSGVATALKRRGYSKNGGATFKALGYSPSDLKKHLEDQFNADMSWDNYGEYWEIDHIKPRKLLPYTSLEDELFKECWCLKNLRPVSIELNSKKKDRYPYPE